MSFEVFAVEAPKEQRSYLLEVPHQAQNPSAIVVTGFLFLLPQGVIIFHLCTMNLIIDAGNTAVKLAVFDQNELLDVSMASPETINSGLDKILDKYPDIQDAILSSVAFISPEQLKLTDRNIKLLVVDHQIKTPFKNAYATPETLGADRVALAAAATAQYPGKNVLVIDAGTCITYEMITEDATYLGGAISPGLRMRFQSLHHFTSNLPDLDPAEFPDFIGDSTEHSIQSGVINGLCREIEGVIAQYESRFPLLTVNLTGGDAQFLSNRLKKAIFAHSNFLLEGLNFLLEYNKR